MARIQLNEVLEMNINPVEIVQMKTGPFDEVYRTLKETF